MEAIPRRWWYPICGKERGWCLSEDGCKLEYFQFQSGKCSKFVKLHPVTKALPSKPSVNYPLRVRRPR